MSIDLPRNYVGRLAPSPTGAQHVGNARTFLVAWLLARQSSGSLVLRMEDLDTPRTKAGAAAQAAEDLQWLGLDWDESEHRPSLIQSERTERYAYWLAQLKVRERVYPCTCSRKEIESIASAPHEGMLDGVIYPGTCRERTASDAERLDEQRIKYAWRYRFPSGQTTWCDDLFGNQSLDGSIALGDFVVARNYGEFAYQLAVVIDDYECGINHIVRGSDLIYSTYRQIALYDEFGWRHPRWLHVPLVVGPDGKRLAKRHGDTRLSTLRAQGVRPDQLLGQLSRSLGLLDLNPTVDTKELLAYCQENPTWWQSIPKDPWVYQETSVAGQ